MSYFVPHKDINTPSAGSDDAWYTYTCGHCGTKVCGGVVALKPTTRWLQCPECGAGSVQDRPTGNIYPGSLFGPQIKGLPTDIAEAYEEARRSISVAAFTGAELVCRKILMYVAVEKAAKEGETFASYLDHLQSAGYITPPMKGWVDLIRQHGNIAAHELQTPDRKRAENTLMFTAQLLRIVYEMEHLGKQYSIEDTEEDSNA